MQLKQGSEVFCNANLDPKPTFSPPIFPNPNPTEINDKRSENCKLKPAGYKRITIILLTFRTRVTGDASPFTDEVLIPGFVVGIHNIRDSISWSFQSLLAQAMVTFADDAIDATVSARGDDLGDSCKERSV